METINTGVPLSGGSKVAKGGNKNTKMIITLVVLGIIIAAIVVAVLVFIPKGDKSGDTTGGSNTPESTLSPEEVSAEEQRITEETLNNVVDVQIGGYQKVDDNEISSDIVAVTIKNKSDKMASIEVVIGAYDKDGNLLETSALYAEGAEPGVTQEFQLFPYTNLTPEQLQTASYKVYKAATYEPSNTAEEAANNTPAEAPAAEPAAEPATENQ